MKRKKVLLFLTVMSISAAMAVPQTISPFSTVVAQAAETGESGENSTYEDGTVKVAYCGNEESLNAALANLSGNEEAASTIYITDNITYTGDYIRIPAGKYAIIQSLSADGKPFTITAAGSCNDTTTRNVSGFILGDGTLYLQNIIFDANKIDRVAYVKAGASLTLGNGAVLKNGSSRSSGNGKKATAFNGSGVYLLGTLVMNRGSEITGCSYQKKNQTDAFFGLAVYVQASGTFTMYGGQIDKNVESNYVQGGGVYSLGTFNMFGGSIQDNEIFGYGAGCALMGGTSQIGRTSEAYEKLSAEEKEICDETAVISGNILTDPADVNGKVSAGNNATLGAGLYAGAKDIAILDTAKITGNKTQSSMYNQTASGNGTAQVTYRGSGGGIYVSELGDVTMNGGLISENSVEGTGKPEEGASADQYHYASGGGVYVKGQFTMNGGEISGNKASAAWTDNALAGNGGGVCVGFNSSTSSSTPGTFIMSGGTIKNNTAARGNDVYVADEIPVFSSNGVPGGAQKYAKVGATPLFQVSGSPWIGSVYLPGPGVSTVVESADEGTTTEKESGEAVISVSAALSDKASVGVIAEKDKIGTVIARPVDPYMLQSTDESAVKYAGTAEGGELRLDSDGNLSLQEKKDTRTSLENADITLKDEDKSVTYTGEPFTPEPVVMVGTDILTKDVDYKIDWDKNTDAGEAVITITGIGDYKDSKIQNFMIAPRSVQDSSVRVSDIGTVIEKEGEALNPSVDVSYNGKSLTCKTGEEENYDYDMTVTKESSSVGVVTIEGHGNFTGHRVEYFAITDAAGQFVVSDSHGLEYAIENAKGTTKDDPLIISLQNDIDLGMVEGLDGMVTLPENTYVRINGYGHTILSKETHYATDENSETGMFIVPSGASLQLSNLTLDGKYQERLVYVKEKGTLTVDSDVVLNKGKATDVVSSAVASKPILAGHSIYNAGTVNFSGTVSNPGSASFWVTGVSDNCWYGVIYNTGTFSMKEGAVIKEIKTLSNGAIYNEGTFEMHGGTITETSNRNTQGGSDGSAVAVSNLNKFTLFDGKITGNDSVASAVYNAGAFTMEGGEISGNTIDLVSSGIISNGTVFMKSGTFDMTGGKISGNSVKSNGGAFYVVDGIVTINGKEAEISNNKAVNTGFNGAPGGGSSCGGAIFMRGGQVNLLQGSVTGNEVYYGSESSKKAQLGDKYYENGVFVETKNLGKNQKSYGLGGAIFVDSGTLVLGDAEITGNKSAAGVTDGIVFAEDMIASNEDTASAVELSGAVKLDAPVWMALGKRMTITKAMADDMEIEVYQQQKDFRLVENGGSAIAVYKDAQFMNKANDGAKFKVFKYADDTEAYYEPENASIDRYSVLENGVEITGTTGIYANIPGINVAELNYEFTDAYGRNDDTGEYFYKYNAATRNKPGAEGVVTPQIKAVSGEGEEAKDVSGSLKFAMSEDQNPTDVGRYTVKVTPQANPAVAGMYHYTGEAEIPFSIIPFDFTKVGDWDENESVKFTIQPVEYNETDAEDKAYEPDVTGTVRLPYSMKETTLKGANITILPEGIKEDFTVTYENNNNPNGGTAKALITGQNNYSGTVTETFELKPVQEILGDTSVTKRENDEAFKLNQLSRNGGPDAKLTYEIDDTSVAVIDKDTGEITIKGQGEAVITVHAAETDLARPAMKTIKLTVSEKEHVHSLESVPAKKATCTEAGNESYWICTDCGKVYTDKKAENETTVAEMTIPATGHTWGDWKVTREATCSEEGARERICKDCNEKQTQTIPVDASAHKLSKTEAVAPTCTETGTKEYYSCADCGKLFEDEAGTIEITKDELTVAAAGHSWSEWKVTKPATCTEKGSEERVCSVCGETETREVPLDLTAHHMIKTEAIAATCTTDGNTEYYTCTDCHHIYADEAGTQEIKSLSETVVKAGGHRYGDWTVVKEATKTEEGLEERTCEVCKETEQRTIPVLGHEHLLMQVEAKEATCTEDGNIECWICTGCGRLFKDMSATEELNQEDTVIPAKGHSWGEWQVLRAATEEMEGIEQRVCEVCGERENHVISKLAHTHKLVKTDRQEATCTEPGNAEYYRCSGCDRIFADSNAEHELNSEDIQIPALGHAWGEWVVTTAATETSEGVETQTCANCQETRTRAIAKLAHTHSMTPVAAREATCADDGNIAYYACSICGKYFTDEDGMEEITLADTVIKATGAHTFGDWKVTKEATATEDGAEERICEVCGLKETRTIPATGEEDNSSSPIVVEDGSVDVLDDNGEKVGEIVFTYSEEKEIDDADKTPITPEYVLSKAVKEVKENGGKIEDDLQVVEIFDISYLVDGKEQSFDKTADIKLTGVDVKKSDKNVTVLHQHNGEWSALEVIDWGDGYVTVRFEGFSPGAILVASRSSDKDEKTNTGGSDSANAGDNGSANTGDSDSRNNGNDNSGNAGGDDNNSDNTDTANNPDAENEPGTVNSNGATGNGVPNLSGTSATGNGLSNLSGTSATGSGLSNLSSTSSSGKTGLSPVKTGDPTDLRFTYGALAAAFVTLLGIGIGRKRRRKEKTE